MSEMLLSGGVVYPDARIRLDVHKVPGAESGLQPLSGAYNEESSGGARGSGVEKTEKSRRGLGGA